MQISGEYGTELLIRYNEEQLVRDLERRRIVNERLAERAAEKRHGATIGARLAALFGAHRDERMPSRTRTTGGAPAHAAHQ